MALGPTQLPILLRSPHRGRGSPQPPPPLSKGLVGRRRGGTAAGRCQLGLTPGMHCNAERPWGGTATQPLCPPPPPPGLCLKGRALWGQTPSGYKAVGHCKIGWGAVTGGWKRGWGWGYWGCGRAFG